MMGYGDHQQIGLKWRNEWVIALRKQNRKWCIRQTTANNSTFETIGEMHADFE